MIHGQHQALGVLPTRDFWRERKPKFVVVFSALILAAIVNEWLREYGVGRLIRHGVNFILSAGLTVLGMGLAERIVRRKEKA